MMNIEELHYLLLKYGLFEPEEWNDITPTLHKMEELNMWEIVEKEFNHLKEEWEGPDLPIFIFPIKYAHLPFNEGLPHKNGVAFKEALFLFLSPHVVSEEIKALLAHEYNHACRLSFLNVEAEDLYLKDSLVMEGLGECAVQELYGKKWLAPWTRIYTYGEARNIWEKQFVPILNTKGNDKHQILLYGKGNAQLPKWIGYNIGFQIIDSFIKRKECFNSRDMLTMSSEKLIAGSNFPYK
ncbi:DUF2268 domain-containing protein [Halobacillus amylolyticus]|uniref:DUF2268 domain-containing protein n=1 Tax=Halobacillus amylolyticus TaxID=2932259 RepID=A0ABY4HJ55_9BACI|nr:DUF2268 domain-containing putative Zn-dependent protease [Halobacillus amylolyticus]UOR13505.1 DUF2268 domain-containing protein [Halobacillus amylolyticus]